MTGWQSSLTQSAKNNLSTDADHLIHDLADWRNRADEHGAARPADRETKSAPMEIARDYTRVAERVAKPIKR